MFDALLESYESLAYPIAYFGTIAVVGFWEVLAPRRRLSVSFLRRWPNAFGLMMVNTVLFRYAVPLLTIPFAIWIGEQQFGLFNSLDAPLWLSIFLCFWIFDFGRWTQHWLLHRVPLLWRLHRTHHVDLDYDFTTGLRFHPGDAFFTTGCQLLIIALLGAPVEAVLLFELVGVVTAMFAHGNFKIPLKIDRVLRLVLVTPDVHRIHHSAAEDETNSNYGGFVPWWDRLLGTYKDQPTGGHEQMTMGLEEFRDPKHLQLHWALANPFLDARKADEKTASTDGPSPNDGRENEPNLGELTPSRPTA